MYSIYNISIKGTEIIIDNIIIYRCALTKHLRIVFMHFFDITKVFT